MNLSVAVCTFQGGRFVDKQLTSIAEQSRLPDEVIVSDDGSTDETIQIVERFAAGAPFSVRVIRNNPRLGIVKNFEQAIAASTGTVIALADQDDVWRRDKLAAIETAFARDRTLACLFTNARQIDADDRPTGDTLWDHIGFRAAERRRVRAGRAFEVLGTHNVVTGATMAFRSDVRVRVLPIPAIEGMIHDEWIALVVSAYARVSCIDDTLIDYRGHPEQHMGAGSPAGGVAEWVDRARTTGRMQFLQWASQFEVVLTRLRAFPDVPTERMEWLQRRIDHLRFRAALPATRMERVRPVLEELIALRYHRYSRHFWSAAKDIFWNIDR
jgi:glycosyltransferase involved in cell wall biosynthesis